MSLETFTAAYIEAAFWSSSGDDDCEYLDQKYGIDDMEPRSLERMKRGAECFYRAHSHLWADMSDEQAGHDMWLTRNRHGVGYWDRPYEHADKLTELSQALGEVTLHACDGRVYLENDGRAPGEIEVATREVRLACRRYGLDSGTSKLLLQLPDLIDAHRQWCADHNIALGSPLGAGKLRDVVLEQAKARGLTP